MLRICKIAPASFSDTGIKTILFFSHFQKAAQVSIAGRDSYRQCLTMLASPCRMKKYVHPGSFCQALHRG